LEFRNVDFYGGRKTGEPGEKYLWQGREPTNSDQLEPKPRIKPIWTTLPPMDATLNILCIYRYPGLKIIFRKILKFAGFLGVADFFGRLLLMFMQRYAFVSEVRWTRTLNTNVLSF
jgi:hypothetical protein